VYTGDATVCFVLGLIALVASSVVMLLLAGFGDPRRPVWVLFIIAAMLVLPMTIFSSIVYGVDALRRSDKRRGWAIAGISLASLSATMLVLPFVGR
jgi:hypothetical protein